MPKIQLKDVQKAIKVGKEVLPMVQPYIEQYAPIIIEQVQEKANLAAQNGKKAKLEFLNGIQEKKEAKGLNKAADDNRKKAVNSSLPPITQKPSLRTSRTTFLMVASLIRAIWALPAATQFSL